MRMIPKTMPWKCLDCHAKFEGPSDRTPADGCSVCGSRRIFDCNVEPVAISVVCLSESDWDDVADLCEQGASACEIGYEEHTKRARKRAAQWMSKLAMRAQRLAVAAGSIEANAGVQASERSGGILQ